MMNVMLCYVRRMYRVFKINYLFCVRRNRFNFFHTNIRFVEQTLFLINNFYLKHFSKKLNTIFDNLNFRLSVST